MIYTAIMGHGVVGSGLAEILIGHSDLISKKTGEEIKVKYILDLRDFPGLSYTDRFTKDFNDILNDESIKIVAEVMGGINPAYQFTKQCLLAGKSVVTSNKELVAEKGDELLRIARDNNVNYMFEASVGGGIPIIRPLTQCLAANEIKSITGILNGTTNFILNKMIVDNMDFDSALKLAQENGYAEKDPTADIEGYDAARKVCILASIAFGRHIYEQNVETEGIKDVSLKDIEYADSFNCVIKLIGKCERLADGYISASVRPTLVSRENMLSNVNGVFNAITVYGDQTGEVMFYGKGAGKSATASAVAADVIDSAQHLHKRKNIMWQPAEKGFVEKTDEAARMYVYAHSEDFNALESDFESVFKGNCLNIKNKFCKEIAFITDAMPESEIKKLLSELPADSIKIMHTLF